MGRRRWLNVRQWHHAFKQTDRQTRGFIRNTCQLLAQTVTPRTCSHSSGSISPPDLSLETCSLQFHHICPTVTRRSLLGNTTPLVSSVGRAVPLYPGLPWALAGSLPPYSHPEPPCHRLFFGVRGIPGAGKTQLLSVPHPQCHGLCSTGVADASCPLGLVVWSHGGPGCGLRPCHPCGLQAGKNKQE